MSDPEFAGSSYPSVSAMLDGMAETWLCANGQNGLEAQRFLLEMMGDRALALDSMYGWGLGVSIATDADTENPPHMQVYDYDADMLAAAFGRVRQRVLAKEPSEG